MKDLCKSQPLHLTQRKAPLATIRIIPPPIRHGGNLPAPEKQKYKQHIKIKTSIKRRRQNIIIPRPELIPVSICPIHYDEWAEELGEVAGGNIAVEVREAGEEDGGVPEVEL